MAFFEGALAFTETLPNESLTLVELVVRVSQDGKDIQEPKRHEERQPPRSMGKGKKHGSTEGGIGQDGLFYSSVFAGAFPPLSEVEIAVEGKMITATADDDGMDTFML